MGEKDGRCLRDPYSRHPQSPRYPILDDRPPMKDDYDPADPANVLPACPIAVAELELELLAKQIAALDTFVTTHKKKAFCTTSIFKPAEELSGLELQSFDGKTLTVDYVDDPYASWFHQQPLGRRVLPGDAIVAVDGIHGDAGSMKAALERKDGKGFDLLVQQKKAPTELKPGAEKVGH